jgi:iron complex outermembrane receptor protein
VREELSLIGGLTWIDAEQRSTGNAAQDGKRAPGVPRIGLSLTGDWRVPAVPGLGVYAGVFRFGSQYVDALNTQQIPGWTRVDAGVRWRLPLSDGARATTLLLNVDNLADKRYWASAGAGLQVGTPRTWRVSARFDL